MSHIPLDLPRSGFGEISTASPKQLAQVSFQYNVNTRIVNVTTSGTGSVTQSDSLALISTGASSSSEALIGSVRILRYLPGLGALARFAAVFDTPATGNNQEVGIGDEVDQFAFGYQDTTFGIVHKQNSSVDFISQASWSEDKADGTGILPIMNWQKGNVYAIRYQWLGFGVISFYIEHPEFGLPVLVHRIEYPNANTVPSVYNPNLPLHAHCENITNTTDIVLKIGSMGGFLEGENTETGFENSIDNTKTLAATTLTNILTVRNKSTFASKTNRVTLRPNISSFAADGNKPIVCRIIRNATLGGTPSYTDIDINTSVVDYDVAGTTVTGGQNIASFGIAKSGNDIIDLRSAHLEVAPGDTVTLAAYSASTSDVTASITWLEEF